VVLEVVGDERHNDLWPFILLKTSCTWRSLHLINLFCNNVYRPKKLESQTDKCIFVIDIASAVETEIESGRVSHLLS